MPPICNIQNLYFFTMVHWQAVYWTSSTSEIPNPYLSLRALTPLRCEAITSVKRCWMTIARASTLLFPWTSSLFSWLMLWFPFSVCSLLCLAWTVAGLLTLCMRDPVLWLDREAVLALNPWTAVTVDPESALELPVKGTDVIAAFELTTSPTWQQHNFFLRVSGSVLDLS